MSAVITNLMPFFSSSPFSPSLSLHLPNFLKDWQTLDLCTSAPLSPLTVTIWHAMQKKFLSEASHDALAPCRMIDHAYVSSPSFLTALLQFPALAMHLYFYLMQNLKSTCPTQGSAFSKYLFSHFHSLSWFMASRSCQLKRHINLELATTSNHVSSINSSEMLLPFILLFHPNFSGTGPFSFMLKDLATLPSKCFSPTTRDRYSLNTDFIVSYLCSIIFSVSLVQTKLTQFIIQILLFPLPAIFSTLSPTFPTVHRHLYIFLKHVWHVCPFLHLCSSCPV